MSVLALRVVKCMPGCAHKSSLFWLILFFSMVGLLRCPPSPRLQPCPPAAPFFRSSRLFDSDVQIRSHAELRNPRAECRKIIAGVRRRVSALIRWVGVGGLDVLRRPWQVGMIMAAYPAVNLATSPLVGWIMNRYAGQKPCVEIKRAYFSASGSPTMQLLGVAASVHDNGGGLRRAPSPSDLLFSCSRAQERIV